MPLTNFPQGLSSFGIPLIGAGPSIYTGKVFFVHFGTGANGTGRGDSTDKPLKTLTYAISQARANKGDLIVLMPGHAEDVTAAGSITMNKAGVSVIGVGTGALRPTFTFKTVVGATILVSAANTFWQNIVFDYTGIDAINTGLSITGAYTWIYDCLFIMANVTNQATYASILGTGADHCRYIRCNFRAPNAGASAAIGSAVAVDGLRVEQCSFDGDFSVAAIHNNTIAWTRCTIIDCLFNILGTGKSFVAQAATTGFVARNHSQIAANIAAGGSMTAAACLKSENYAQETAGIAASTVVDPASAAIT